MCKGNENTQSATWTRNLGVHLSGGGWAESGSSYDIPWPLPCIPSFVHENSNRITVAGDEYGEGSSGRLWSETLITDFGGSAESKDVTIASGETLIIDSDMNCQYLVVEGSLRWDTSIDGLSIEAAGILVLQNGSFELGTQESPMMLDASVRIKSLNDTLDYSISDDDYTTLDDFDSEFGEGTGNSVGITVDPYSDIKDNVGLR